MTLDLGGYLVEPYTADVCFESQVCGMVLGAGDDPERAVESLARAAKRRA